MKKNIVKERLENYVVELRVERDKYNEYGDIESQAIAYAYNNVIEKLEEILI